MCDPGEIIRELSATLDASSDIWINFINGSKVVLYHEGGEWMLEGDGYLRASGRTLDVTDGPNIRISLASNHSPVVARFEFLAGSVDSVYKCTESEGMVSVLKTDLKVCAS